MATQTTNLGLTKQAPGERASLVALNGNFDLIDAFAGNVNDELSLMTAPTLFTGDCNSIDETCTVYVGDGASNSPGSWHILTTIVFNSLNAIVQYGVSVVTGKMVSRGKTGDGWTAWRTFSPTYYVDVTVPVGATAGAYKVGTFESLGIPFGSALLSAQCVNANGSVCVVTGLATYDHDIYVYVAETVAVANGLVRLTYQI